MTIWARKRADIWSQPSLGFKHGPGRRRIHGPSPALVQKIGPGRGRIHGPSPPLVPNMGRVRGGPMVPVRPWLQISQRIKDSEHDEVYSFSNLAKLRKFLCFRFLCFRFLCFRFPRCLQTLSQEPKCTYYLNG